MPRVIPATVEIDEQLAIARKKQGQYPSYSYDNGYVDGVAAALRWVRFGKQEEKPFLPMPVERTE